MKPGNPLSYSFKVKKNTKEWRRKPKGKEEEEEDIARALECPRLTRIGRFSMVSQKKIP